MSTDSIFLTNQSFVKQIFRKNAFSVKMNIDLKQYLDTYNLYIFPGKNKKQVYIYNTVQLAYSSQNFQDSP